VNVKICGVTRACDAVAAAEAGAWAIGMVFDPRSRRRCALAQAHEVCGAVRGGPELAGVFVDAPLGHVATTATRLGLSLVQLHGAETAGYCAAVARLTGARVIKAASASSAQALRLLEAYRTDFHMLDGHHPGASGGTGTSFDWSIVRQRLSSTPLIVAGGLRVENVTAAIMATRPFAVDVASGVERSPGVKDPDKLQAFAAAVRSVEPVAAPSGASAR
jgi:phosphoribosylanthranilate isomerase